jgi:hypothetical protein
MGGAEMGCSDADKEANPLTSHHIDKVLGPPPRHPAAPPRLVDHQHHLPGPPSRHTTARTRATTLHDTATRSPRCTEQTVRRPRPPHQHSGPPSRPKSRTRFAYFVEYLDISKKDCEILLVSFDTNKYTLGPPLFFGGNTLIGGCIICYPFTISVDIMLTGERRFFKRENKMDPL